MAERGEGGQLLILAGVVLILAFLLAAYTVSELGAEQQRLQRGTETDLPKLYREFRDKLASAMNGLAYDTISNATLATHIEATRLELEHQGRGRGVHVAVRLANATDELAPKNETAHFTSAGGTWDCDGAGPPNDAPRRYTVSSYNGSRAYTAVDYDCGNDGIIWDRTVERPTGVLLHLFLSDRAARIEETFAVALN
jgi:hypothetical protein